MLTWKFFLLLVFSTFAGMVVFAHFGRKVATWQRSHRPDAIQGRTGTVEAAVFGLMGLLLAFTFSGAASRFEVRRNLIAEEANTIGTTYLRLDLLPPETQPRLREDFRRYVRSRLAVFEKIPDVPAVLEALGKSAKLQDEIWKQAVAACTKSGSPAVTHLVLSSMNQMIDITTTRTIALQAHSPLVIFAMLGVTALVSSLLAGYSMSVAGRPSLIHIAVFVILVGVSIYVILDYEYPRVGLIRLDSFDAVLLETLERMK